MPLGPDPERARVVVARLDSLRSVVAAAEDDVLASLVVTGEPRPQRVLDDWLDQVADTLRSLGEAADLLAPPLARYAVAPPSPRQGGDAPRTAADGVATRGAPGIRAGSPPEGRPGDHDGKRP